jgi:hypothetical protein
VDVTKLLLRVEAGGNGGRQLARHRSSPRCLAAASCQSPEDAVSGQRHSPVGVGGRCQGPERTPTASTPDLASLSSALRPGAFSCSRPSGKQRRAWPSCRVRSERGAGPSLNRTRQSAT